MFMRLLAPPTPSTTEPGGANSIANGARVFSQIGCALCHTPTMQTGTSTFTASLSNANVNLYSDLLVHNMGNNLADSVSQGGAAGDEFRTAPLWGLGQRVFFLHDGRTSDLAQAIQQHASDGNSQFGPSEANKVVDNFDSLGNQILFQASNLSTSLHTLALTVHPASSNIGNSFFSFDYAVVQTKVNASSYVFRYSSGAADY